TMTTLDALRAAPLFAELPEEDLRRLAEMAQSMSLAQGELLLREGDPGDSMYVVVSGELDVTKLSGGNEVQLARVGAGTIQGEMSAIEGRPRSASVRAITPVEVLRIPPGLAHGVRQHSGGRVLGTAGGAEPPAL